MLDLEYPESYRGIAQSLRLDLGLNYTPCWSAEADFLQLLVDACRDHRPQQILECSSGLSTLVLARCCQQLGQGRVISLENGAEYAAQTRAALALYGLAEWADVRDAPLQPVQLDDAQRFQWYDLAALPAQPPVELLVIDGPPGFLQARSRYPALPVLVDRLAPGARLFLDDAARADERALVAEWRARYPQLQYRYHDTVRGCVELALPA